MTKNPNSKNKILCGRPQISVWTQNREKIILNQDSELWKSISQSSERVMNTDFTGWISPIHIFEKTTNMKWISHILVLFASGIGSRRFRRWAIGYAPIRSDTNRFTAFSLLISTCDVFFYWFGRVIQPSNTIFQSYLQILDYLFSILRANRNLRSTTENFIFGVWIFGQKKRKGMYLLGSKKNNQVCSHRFQPSLSERRKKISSIADSCIY